jgi:DNA-binding transcriptional MerR regulator
MGDLLRPFTTKQAHERCGISRAMISYLRQTGIVLPSKTAETKRGIQALYSFGDLVLLRAVAKLLERGVEVRRLKAGLQALQAECQEIGRDNVDLRILITDGRDVYLQTADELARRIIDGQYAFGFLVEIETVRKEVISKAVSPLTEQRNRRKGISRKPLEKKTA